MDSSQQAATRLAAIDALQDDLLRRLDELERQTAAVLEQCQPLMTIPLKRPAAAALPALTREAA